jgi:hypothetical protein
MKTRGWEGWLAISFLANAIVALFAAVAASASSPRRHQYAY